MEVTSYTNFRQELKTFFDKINANHTPLLVTRAKGEDVVVMSKADFDSMEATFYLLKSPKNADRLLESIEQLNDSQGIEKQLIEK